MKKNHSAGIITLLFLLIIIPALHSFSQEAPIVNINGKRCYEYQIQRDGQRLEGFAEQKGLNYDVLKRQNPELANRPLERGTKVYYPVSHNLAALSDQALIHHVSPQSIHQDPEIQEKYSILQNQPLEIMVVEQNGESRQVQSKLKDFNLREDEQIALVKTDELYIDPSLLQVEARVMEGVFVAKPFDTQVYGSQVQFQLALLQTFPVQINAEKDGWVGSIRLKCIQIGTAGNVPPATIELKEPLRYNLTVNGKDLGDREIPAINIEVPEVYTLLLSDRVLDEVELGLRQVNEAGGIIERAPVTPYISITADKKKIQGYGIQAAKVYVTLVGASTAPPVPVPLKSDKGSLEPETVTVSGNEPLQTVTLRSSGTGNTTVSASVVGFITTDQTVRFVFPWSFIISALIGGIIGTMIRIFGMRKEGFNILSFIAGVLVGLIVALAYWGIGLNLLGLNINIDFMNEVAVLVLSALGGIVGAVKIGKAAGAD
jgi:hypothetical protein